MVLVTEELRGFSERLRDESYWRIDYWCFYGGLSRLATLLLLLPWLSLLARFLNSGYFNLPISNVFKSITSCCN